MTLSVILLIMVCGDDDDIIVGDIVWCCWWHCWWCCCWWYIVVMTLLVVLMNEIVQPPLTSDSCYWLQSNRILKLENLQPLTQLDQLYISHNGLEVIENLQANVSLPSYTLYSRLLATFTNICSPVPNDFASFIIYIFDLDIVLRFARIL